MFIRVNPFPNKPWFLCVCSASLLKTLWEKGKLLVMSNFSFSHNVFYWFGELSAIFIKFGIVVCKLFQFRRVKNLLSGNRLSVSNMDKSIMLLFGKEITLYQTTTFDVIILKVFADGKVNVAKMMIAVFDRVENTVGKRGFAGYQHFLFPQCFPKAFLLGSLKVGIVW